LLEPGRLARSSPVFVRGNQVLRPVGSLAEASSANAICLFDGNPTGGPDTDEPTNHMDIPHWSVSGCTKAFTGAIIIVSHDREFLDEVPSD